MTHPSETEIPSDAKAMQPAYLREGLLHRKQTVYRLDGADIRWYYTISSNGQVQFYGSVTSILDKTMPTSPWLIKWIADHGVQGAARLRDQKAEYGTLLHLVIADYLQQEVYNLNMMQFIVSHYCREHRIQYDTSWWAESLQKDLLSFDAFCKEYQVKPLAVEMVCAAPSLGYAGCIDMVCEMTVMEKGYADGVVYLSGKQQGQPKEVKIPKTVRAIVDFKSGKHQFYEPNEIQANMYMSLWNTCYPEARVERCYNWRPSEWEGVEPTFNLKEQTGVKSSEKIPHLLKLFAIDVPPFPKSQLQMSGTINLNGEFKGIIRRKPAEEIALERYSPAPVSFEQAAAKAVAGIINGAINTIANNSAFAPGGFAGKTALAGDGPTNSGDASTAKTPSIRETLEAKLPIIPEAKKAAKPETLEIVTPVENPPQADAVIYTPPPIEEKVLKTPAPKATAQPVDGTKKQVQTFLPEDDIDNTVDEVITPAPEPVQKQKVNPAPTATPYPDRVSDTYPDRVSDPQTVKKQNSPTLEKMKAELANSQNAPTNGKLQPA